MGSETTQKDNGRVATLIPAPLPSTRPPPKVLVERRKASSSPWPRTQEKTDASCTQQLHGWASWKRRNDLKDKTILLVARPKSLGWRLHQRMRRMSTRKNLDAPNQSPHVQNPNHTGCPSLPNRSNGLDCRTTPQWWPGLHPHAGGPRMLMSSPLSPLCIHNNRPQDRSIISGACISMVWPPKKDDLWPRPTIHLPLRSSTGNEIRSPTELIHCLPSSNRWTVWKEKSVDWTILTTTNCHR